jgi:hypothetical protein
MLIIAFFFLLRPGEYSHTARASETTQPHRSTPFRLCDIHLIRNNQTLSWTTSTIDELNSTTHAALEFSNQKNGIRGERIGLSNSGDPTICPVRALVRRVITLRTATAPPTTPIYTYFLNNRPRHITSTLLTETLRAAVLKLGLPLNPMDISARSLRPGGATALFCANVDPVHIQLHGRWRSDEYLRYLHLQAIPKTSNFAVLMWTHGDFAALPNTPH